MGSYFFEKPLTAIPFKATIVKHCIIGSFWLHFC